MSSQMQDKLVRLRCKSRALLDAYFVNGEIVERDSDVEFQCQDGGVLKAHKIILASASTFFVQLFENQKCGKMTTVCVPDIDTETMQLILKLAYNEKVSISMERCIRDFGDYLSLFGMKWKSFDLIQSIAETNGDINLGGPPDENFPIRNPNELKRCPGPRDNLIQSSITPNKKPRFENPPKEKQRSIQSTSSPSKKDDQNQQQTQIVEDQTAEIPEKQQPIQTSSQPSKKVDQTPQLKPQIVEDLTTVHPAIQNWINSLGKSGVQQNGIMTVDQQQQHAQKSSTDSTGKILFKIKDIPLGAGEVEDCEEKEVVALKGIYWTYFCDKCKQESESIQKAHEHYLQCCEDENPEFVNSLHRYSYNYYGPIKCCRCFKGYDLNFSFSRHCGRSHSEFTEKFSIGNDDKILCGHCKGKFDDPQQFDKHLDKFENCPRGENSSFNEELEVGEIVGENSFEVSRRQRLAKRNNSRSRPHLTETTATSPRVVEQPKLNPTENEATTYYACQCPICEERDVAKIVEHIKKEHWEFKFSIVQVSDMVMKCRTCSTSFAICDLLIHSCEANQQPQQQAKPVVTKTQAKVVTQGGDQEDFIPATGIGKSPIDVMECSDLLNINTIREAFNCQVCGKKGERLSFGAVCLKSHKIYRCPLCFNTYNNKDDYSKHLKVCHGSGSGSKLYCPCCPKDKVYANAGQATHHMFRAHWLPIIRAIDHQEGRSSNLEYSRKIDKIPARTRPAENADKDESNLDVTLGTNFDEACDIDDENVNTTTTGPEDESKDKSQTAVENEDTEINADENVEEGDQDQDESVLLTTDEDETDVEEEDLKNQNESSKEI